MSETCVLCGGKTSIGSKLLRDQNRVCKKCGRMLELPNYCKWRQDIEAMDTPTLFQLAEERKKNRKSLSILII